MSKVAKKASSAWDKFRAKSKATPNNANIKGTCKACKNSAICLEMLCHCFCENLNLL